MRSTRQAATIGHVTSRDGTTIGFRRIGSGPGIVLIHGAMESSYSHVELAQELAGDFTCYLPDRRGRGMSGPHGVDYDIGTAVDDVAAVLAETGARRVLGVSSGALVALESALRLPEIEQTIAFEPPLVVNGSLSTDFMARYEQEIARGDTAAALVTAMLGIQLGPPLLRVLPRRLLELLTKQMMKRTVGEELSFEELAPTLHYDFQLVLEQGELNRFEALSGRVLLLGGSQSPAYLKMALTALEGLLPNAERVELPGVGHSATGNAHMGGKPTAVAAELRRFLAVAL